MKNKYTFHASIIFAMMFASVLSVNAQAPQLINYQAIVRNAQGQPLATTTVNFQFQVHDSTSGGNVEFTETDTATTNQFGLATVQIGRNSNLGAVTWGSGNKYLQVGIDVTGGINFDSIGNAQLNAVPYALSAASSSQWYSSGNDIYNLNTNTTHIKGTPSGSTLRIDNTGAVDYAEFNNHTNSNVGYIGIKSDTTGMDVGTASGNTTGTFNLVTNGNPRVTIVHNGLVGIGTSTPAAQLDIKAASGNNPLHITGLPAGDSTNNVLTINPTTGMVDSIHLLHHIGEHYRGGIVFYVVDHGLHGLIAAIADQSTGIIWSNGTLRVTGAFSGGMGGGAMNTALIIATQIGDNPIGNFAAKICTQYSATDAEGVSWAGWYLPSSDELYLLFLQQTVVGGFSGGYYWSSTEFDADAADVYFMSNGGQSNNEPKDTNLFSVRAIRDF